MKPDGTLEAVTAPNARESAAEAMILYAPRKVTLPPNQPQSIRINARAPEGLPDGEYRAHLLFRAIPDARPATAAKPTEGVSFRLDPDLWRDHPGHRPARQSLGQRRNRQCRQARARAASRSSALDLSRVGDRSTFGEVRVMKAGVAEPIAVAGGIALYTEIDKRSVTVPIDARFAAQARAR